MVNKSTICYKSLGSRAVEIIKSRIIEGKYPQGSRLTEEKLASDFGVSRACIREAIMALETEGLVQKVHNKYTEVVKFDKKSVEDILMLRYAVEALSAEICIKKAIVPLDRLEKQVRKIVSISGEKGHNIRKYLQADLDFHEIIVYSSQNRLAIKVWNSLKSQMKVLLFSAISDILDTFGRIDAKGHRKIIKAFIISDIHEVTTLLRKHIEGAMSNICKNME